MKPIVIAAIMFLTGSQIVHAGGGFTGPGLGYHLYEARGVSQQELHKLALSLHPYRIINESTNRTSEAWINFHGRIAEVQPGGVRITSGVYQSLDGKVFYSGEFFVANFPFDAAENDTVSPDTYLLAASAGTHTYTTIAGASRTIRKLDYGLIWNPPPPTPLTSNQIAAVKSAAAQKKKADAVAALKWNQDQAAAGDAYGELRMGERYRDGDGVEKDITKAREMFSKASSQGNKDADEALKNLPSK
jgi:hypothetical protein